MHFIVKAAMQQVISCLPDAEKVNYLFSRHISKALPVSDGKLASKVATAVRHYQHLCRFATQTTPATAHCFEFGAGWDLIIPLALYSLGIDAQLTTDIRPNVQLDLVNHAISCMTRLHDELERSLNVHLRRLPGDVKDCAELASRCGIQWMAPVDASATSFQPATFDFITNSATLEHIPETVLAAILTECHRILKPSGLISCLVDLKDHYSYSDRSITPYNFLRYEERAWRWLNPALMSQNRLRQPDYQRLFTQAGFEIVQMECDQPDAKDLAALAQLPLASPFKGKYRPEELGVKEIWLVARKG